MQALPIQIKRALEQVEFVSDLLNGWLRDSVASGAPADEMVESLVKMGRPPDIASLMVALAHKGLFLGKGDVVDPRMVARSRLGTPDAPHAQEHWLDLGDRRVRKVMSMGRGNLEVEVYDDFISVPEMDHLKALVAQRLARSAVVGPEFSNVTHQSRTSSGAFIDVGSTRIVQAIEARIERLTKIPVNHGEALQVLHYGNTEEYQPHYDFFEPDDEVSKATLAGPGNRVGTLLLYLNEVDRGGATYFPKLDLAVHPRPGQALWFRYLDQSGQVDYRSEHAGLPIIAGEKWVATKWLRERPIQQPPVNQWAAQGQVVNLGAVPPVL